MKHCVVLIMLLAISIWAGAQTSTTGNQATVVSPGAIAGPNGLSTNTGTAVIIAPPSAPLLVTPEVHLTTVVPAAPGATSATPGNVAGATSSSTNMPVQPRLQTTVPEYATSGATVTQTPGPQATTAPVTTSTTVGGATITTGTPGTGVIVVNNQNLPLDLGVGTPTAVGAFGNTGGRSLGEIAREMRSREAGANAHVYTNQDIQRINQQPAVTIGGMSGAAVGAGNATQQQPSGNMPVVSQPTTNPQPNQGVSQPVPQNPPQSEAVPPSLGQTPRQMAQANAPANPAEQDAQSNENATTGATRSSGRQLPPSGSILPLMAVFGFLAASAGLLAR